MDNASRKPMLLCFAGPNGSGKSTITKYFETVLSSNYKMDILRKSKSEGYFIKCVFVLTADPELNVSRVESRVLQGGHDVDREKVKKRFYKSLANIKRVNVFV